MFKFDYIVWSGILQRSVVSTNTITGKKEVGENVTVKWKGQSFEATILKLGEGRNVANFDAKHNECIQVMKNLL